MTKNFILHFSSGLMRKTHFVLNSRSDEATFECVKMQIQQFKKNNNNTKAEKTVLISKLSTLEEPK